MTKKKLRKKAKILLIVASFLIIFMISSSFLYVYLVSPVDKNSDAIIEVDINSGSSTSQIAKTLKTRELIKSEFLFKVLAKLNNNKTLKASVYQLKKSMSLYEIMGLLTEGNKYNPDAIRITFVPGGSVKKYALQIEKYTNHTYTEVMDKISDTTYLQTLINKYFFLNDEILNPNIYVPLEGYLMPNTYEFKNKDVSIEEIIEVMLNNTEQELTKYKSIFDNSTRSIHEYLTLASMLELEGTNEKNRKMIAGVFNNRIERNMSLGSDVTTYYGIQHEMTSDLTATQFAEVNAYNTRAKEMAGKFPVGPICNPSSSSVIAATSPADNDYLFFVADKHGKIYFTKTEAEHLQKVKEIKEAGDWIW